LIAATVDVFADVLRFDSVPILPESEVLTEFMLFVFAVIFAEFAEMFAAFVEILDVCCASVDVCPETVVCKADSLVSASASLNEYVVPSPCIRR
jgi:hypothetical protein